MQATAHSPATSLLGHPPTLAVILGDFGRDAGIQLAASLASAERALIQGLLGSGTPFFDEYRRLTLTLKGDLPFCKQPRLERVLEEGAPLDSSILVGFPDGVDLEEVVPRLGVLALEAMRGPLQRGYQDIVVLLPCNTLAPVSWALEQCFSREDSLRDMLTAAGPEHVDALREAVPMGLAARPVFPTVPASVLRQATARGFRTVMPLGTLGIASKYREAARRGGSGVRVVAPSPEDQAITLEAIHASLSQDRARRVAAQRALERIAAQARDDHGADLAVVEACTDLDYGVGLDSNALYAQDVVERLYAPFT